MPVDFQFTGRMVQGDPHKAQPPSKDPVTKQVKIDKKTGLPVVGRFFVALAIPKNPADRIVIQGLPSYEQSKAALDAEAKTAWPQYFPANGVAPKPELPVGCTNPTFANKIIDGDGTDDKGQKWTQEGYAGCWVIKFDNGFAPKVHEWTANGWAETIHTGRTIKCGDYVTVKGDAKTNGSAESPGLYMNFTGVAFEREGAAIVSAAGIDPNEAYGSRAGGPTSAGAANPPAAAATAPNSPTASPGEPPAPPPAGSDRFPIPAGMEMKAGANGISYAAYREKGWTDDVLQSNGLLGPIGA